MQVTHGGEHLVAEVGQVAGPLVHLPVRQWRRVDVLVAVSAFELAQILLDGVPGGGPGRQPDRQAGAHHRRGMEDLQVPAESSMIDHCWFSLCARGAGAGHTRRETRGAAPGLLRRSSRVALSRDDAGNEPASSWLSRSAWLARYPRLSSRGERFPSQRHTNT